MPHQQQQQRNTRSGDWADRVLMMVLISETPIGLHLESNSMQVGRMNKLLQNVNLAGTSLFLNILWVR
jgi:hypothetical protein